MFGQTYNPKGVPLEMFKSCGLKPSALSEVSHELSVCYAGNGAEA